MTTIDVGSCSSIAPSESTISVVSSSADFEEETLPELYTHHTLRSQINPDVQREDTDELANNLPLTNNDTSTNDNAASENEVRTPSIIYDDTNDSFFLIRCDHDPPVQDAVFLLSAPNSLWLKGHDWLKAPPCQLSFNFR